MHHHYERFADDPTPPKCDVCAEPSDWRVGVAYGRKVAFYFYACGKHRRQLEARARRTAYVGLGPARISREGRWAF